MSKVNVLENYLGTANLLESLKLTSNVSFHWSNWDQTCLIQRKLNRKFQGDSQLLKLNADLLKLKQKIIWLKNSSKTMKSDLYSLYESYLDSRLRMTWFDRKDDIQYSESSEEGPFLSLTNMKWLDKDTYSKFVYRKILTDFCTLRSFRLNTEFPIEMKFSNDSIIYASYVSIHQISEAGMILKIKNKNHFNKWLESKHIDFKIRASVFQEIIPELKDDQKILDLRIDSNIMNLYGNSSNFKRVGEDEFYVFVKYEDFSCSEKTKRVFNSIIDFVKVTKDSLSNQLSIIDKAA